MRRCLFVRSSRELEFTGEWTRGARCYGELHFYVAERVRGDGATTELDELRSAGWLVAEVVPDFIPLQTTWAAERASSKRGADVLFAQLREFAPDVAFIDGADAIPEPTLRQVRNEVRHLVGRVRTTFDDAVAPGTFDLLFVDDPELACRLEARGDAVVTRSSSMDDARHDAAFLSWLARPTDVAFLTQDAAWCPAFAESLSRRGRSVDVVTAKLSSQLTASPVDSFSRHDQDERSASVFQRASRARLALVDVPNSRAHIELVRLAARAGAMVVARFDEVICGHFELGVEASAYRSAEECAALVELYLARPNTARAMAQAGIARERRDRAAAVRLREELGRLVRSDSDPTNLPRLTSHARLERTGASP